MNVLYLTHRVPYAPNRGDRLRAFYTLRLLASSHRVSLVALAHDRTEAEDLTQLRRMTAQLELVPTGRVDQALRVGRGLLTGRPLTHCLLDARGMRRALARVIERQPPDVVLAYCSGMARFAMERPLAGIPFVLDLVDVDSAKWADLALRTSGPVYRMYAREARRLAAFEAQAIAAARVTLVVNDRERRALLQLTGQARTVVVPNGVDVDMFDPPAAARQPEVVFCGVMNYAPNVEGAVWLARSVWPRVRQTIPHARLLLVGANPARAVRALASARDGIEVTGSVPDVRPYLWRASVAAAPLTTARGVQNKVLEAIAAGLPCAITEAVAEGLPSEAIGACVQADEPGAFSTALVRLLRMSDAERRHLVAQASVSRLGWISRMAALTPILEAAAHSMPLDALSRAL